MSPASWEFAFGDIPFKVVAFENLDRKGVVYLRWRAEGNWRYESLRFRLRTAEGKILKTREREAKEAAKAKHHTLLKGLPPAERPKPALLLGETAALLTDPHRGAYPVDTPHRRELLRSLAFVGAVLGERTAWLAIRPSHVREVWRRRLEGVRANGREGRRSAQVVVRDLRAIASKLREEELIPDEACRFSAKKIQAEIEAATPEARVHRPRYTREEMHKLMAHSWDVDPRLGFMVALGGELRLGQVVRARRSALDLAKGRFHSPGQGKKRGEVVVLTPGQRASVTRAMNGYLRELEATNPDYPLFPSGPLAGGRVGEGVAKEHHAAARPVDRTTLTDWWRACEKAAGIPHIHGRGYYGVRRGSTDGAKEAGISREGLQKIGGWADSQVPDQIYADQDAEYAREEAATVRAKIRGEKAVVKRAKTRGGKA